ncbi:heavy metal translocating P-type ATPase [Raoultibacter phocaeensis]|uniref:heavy metal translocating P-type ATPase n=1 Tax=Raoultibacter phocaeensis TaxID=2479841 RepID=UPI0015D5B07A|nr:heavy metal translocating P-type ATPase [Raoultibacter phocaeensis]
MKQTFDVTGMTCAACSARVEKTANAVPGVEKATVNLLKNSMDVDYDGAPATIEALTAAIDKAGYGAEPRVDISRNQEGAPASRGSVAPVNAAAKEAKAVKTRLIISFVFTVPLFYLSMGHMFGWPLPSIFLGEENVLVFAFTQFLLLLPVIFVNFKFFRVGFKALFHRSPNMDSLIALGATASTVYGIYAIYKIGWAIGWGNAHTAHLAAMDLYFESAAMILTLITLGKYFEARAKGKTTDAISKLMDLSPKTATRLVNDVEEVVPAENVHAGDLLVVKAGEGVPADGVLVEGAGTLDESVITGESVPVEKGPGDPVTGATVLSSGWFTMRAEKVGEETALANIIRLVDEATSSKAPIEKMADKISGVFVPIVIVIAIVTFIVWIVLGGTLEVALSHAVTVLVISCPCALGLATPTAIMVGTGRGAASGILVKSAEALETAHGVSTVVLDKTGTITQGKPQVTDVIVVGATGFAGAERSGDTAAGANADGSFEGSAEHAFLSFAASVEVRSEHPLAQAVVAFAGARNALPSTVETFSQIPGEGIAATVEGDECFAGNLRMMEARGIDASFYRDQAQALADDGKTVLYFARAGRLVGLIAVADVVKPTSKLAIDELRQMGISTVMLTGDNERTAAAIQRRVGVDTVIAGVLPQDKERTVRELSARGTVAMVGDGINDAPALARADVGIAIGAGTDIAIESADIVLMHSDLVDVPSAIGLSRATMRNIKQNLFWALFYNAICIPIAAGVLAGIGINLNPMIAAAAMSLSSVFVVGNALRLRRWKPARLAAEGPSELSETARTELASADSMDETTDAALAGATKAQLVDDDTRENGKDTIMEKVLDVEGMMCQHCVAHVRKALEGIDGVEGASVDLDAGTATAKLSADVADDALIAAVVDAGYEAKIAG